MIVTSNSDPNLQNLIWQAIGQAEQLGHFVVSPEHLLLSLLQQQDQECLQFLKAYGIETAQLQQEILVRLGTHQASDQKPSAKPYPSLSLRALSIVRYSEQYAELNRRDWSSLQLLFAILQDLDCIAAKVLKDQKLDIENATAALEERLGENTRRRPGTFATADSQLNKAEYQYWRQKLKGAEEFFSQHIIGQPQAIERVCLAIYRAWAGLKESGRPLASLLFVGPPGSGKTTVAEKLAEFLYNDPRRCFRFDMNTYNEGERLYSLIGNPSGQDDGLLSRINRDYPHAILLFEDAHRAHPRVQSLLTEIVATGQSQDMRGLRLDFRESLIVLYVNVDSELLTTGGQLGFRRGNDTIRWSKVEESLSPQLDNVLGPELMGLLDEVIFFRALHVPDFLALIEKWAEALKRRILARRGINLEFDTEALNWLANQAHDTGKGAGFLYRIFVREIENRLAQAMLDGTVNEGDGCRLEKAPNAKEGANQLEWRVLETTES